MYALNAAKRWIGALTEVGLMLIAFGIVAGLLYPGAVPFIGTDVVGNITAVLTNFIGKSLGAFSRIFSAAVPRVDG